MIKTENSLEMEVRFVKLQKTEQRRKEVRHASHKRFVETLIYSAEGGANMHCFTRAGAVERAHNLFQNFRARSGRRCPNRREVPGVARTLADWTSSAESGETVGVS